MRLTLNIALCMVLALGMFSHVGCSGAQDPAKKPGFRAETASDPSKIQMPTMDTKKADVPEAKK